jgi:beta-mannanase
VATPVKDSLLQIVDQRCITGRNGATWLIGEFERQVAKSADRMQALRSTTIRYEEHMHANTPVHSWPVG